MRVLRATVVSSICALLNGSVLSCSPLPGSAASEREAARDKRNREQLARYIYSQAQQRYASAPSYADSAGVTTSLHIEATPPVEVTEHSALRTFYERASRRFLLDLLVPQANGGAPPSAGAPDFAVWGTAPGNVNIWFAVDGVVKDLGFQDAIARTDFALVPWLLVTGSGRALLPNQIEAVGSEMVRGTPCDVLREQRTDSSRTFWFARTDHTLRRMADEARVPPGPIKPSHEQAVRRLLSRTGRDALWPSARSHWSVYRRVVDFTPTIGGRIPESSFAFAPPSVRPAVDRCAGREAVATGGDPVIDSFEAANGFLPPVDHRVGRWWVYGDEGCVVLPQRAHADAPGGENPSHFALHVAASDCTEWGFGLGFALNLAGSRCSYDASIYDGIYFWARSGEDPVEARFNVGTRQTEPFDYGGDGSCEGKGGGLSCWDQHSVALTLTANWRQFAYTWAELKQMGWGYAAIFDPKALTSVGLSAPQQPSKRREMWLDQVSFFKGQAPPSPFHEPKN